MSPESGQQLQRAAPPAASPQKTFKNSRGETLEAALGSWEHPGTDKPFEGVIRATLHLWEMRFVQRSGQELQGHLQTSGPWGLPCFSGLKQRHCS